MKRASLLVCALGSMLLLATGCDTMGFKGVVGVAAVDALADARDIDGAPETVAVTLQAMLKARGFEAKVAGAGDDMVLHCKTAGMDFALMLHRVRGDNGRDQTHVTVQWMGSSKDDRVHAQVIADLDKQPGVKK
jgi:hypothetical protein